MLAITCTCFIAIFAFAFNVVTPNASIFMIFLLTAASAASTIVPSDCNGENSRGMGYDWDGINPQQHVTITCGSRNAKLTCLAVTQKTGGCATTVTLDTKTDDVRLTRTNGGNNTLVFLLSVDFYFNHGPAENKRFQNPNSGRNYWDRIIGPDDNSRFGDLVTMAESLASAFPQGTSGVQDGNSTTVDNPWYFYAPNGQYYTEYTNGRIKYVTKDGKVRLPVLLR